MRFERYDTITQAGAVLLSPHYIYTLRIGMARIFYLEGEGRYRLGNLVDSEPSGGIHCGPWKEGGHEIRICTVTGRRR